MGTERLNFSWLIDREVAGHQAPMSDDDLAYLSSRGVEALIRMAAGDQVRVTFAQVEKAGLTDYHEPVPDFTAPSEAQIDGMIAFMKRSVDEGKPVGVSCYAGKGRTGTILACYLVSTCLDAEEAIGEVRGRRPGSIEGPEQESAIRGYAKRLGK